MRIEGIIWLRGVVEKIASKHQVQVHEVEEVLAGKPIFRLAQRGRRQGEDVYFVLGQSEVGRYLSILFIYKRTKEALILSARDMARGERRYYERHKQT